MGFLRFLKKKEELKSADDELDIPPAPPSIEGDLGLEPLEEELPKPPELPELPEIEEEMGKEVEEKTPEIPSFKPERFVSLEKMERSSVREEKKILKEVHEHKVTRPIFVKISRYKYVLDEIETIKSYLDNLESASIRLDGLMGDKDRKFEKWNEHFKDLQKKLVFVDNTLFAK